MRSPCSKEVAANNRNFIIKAPHKVLEQFVDDAKGHDLQIFPPQILLLQAAATVVVLNEVGLY